MPRGAIGCARPGLPERDRRTAEFLAAAGWRGADIQPLAGDASFRRYHRVHWNGSRAVLMEAPPDREDVRPFLHMARHLLDLGLSAPAIFAADETVGLVLLEDFGDDTFTRLLSAGHDETSLYRLAIDVLIHLHRLEPEAALPAGLPTYDTERLVDEALLLCDWYMPAACGPPIDEGACRAYIIAAWQEAFTPVLSSRPTLVLRDFHVDNLMRLSGRDGLKACGLLDFQDALAGPAAYDVMSLLEDARRDVSPALKAEMLARYAAGIGNADWELFDRAFAVLAAQRHAKVIGIFTRLSRRDGKDSYLAHIPRVWRLLERALAHDALAPVARWFDEHLPRPARVQPASLSPR
jgi:aminoglycoside/choline kinase family phosphotransferase